MTFASASTLLCIYNTELAGSITSGFMFDSSSIKQLDWKLPKVKDQLFLGLSSQLAHNLSC